MKKLSQKTKSVIDRIQASIPQYLRDSVIEKRPASPEVKEVLEKGILDEEFSQETRDKWKLVLDSGLLDKEIEVEVPEIAQEINAYVELEMARAVIRKEIPKPKHKFVYEELYKNYNLIKEYNDKKFNRTS